ncbi:MAG: UTP--glucose-1-phosphate uridylyltransferase GalU [Thermovirgaceae bacterium]|nr:UTP--glucose-1-phosphate uridylyltransferase GalU [Thermovirgaceae bacterium]
MTTYPVTKCLFPVAGMGTRFLPATKEIPKEMLPLIDRPLIHYGVEEAVDSGCKDIVFVTGRGKRAIEDYFDRSMELEQILIDKGKPEYARMVRRISEMAEFAYVRQSEPLGLGHAVLCGESCCRGGYFGVILPDDVMLAPPGFSPVLKQLIEVHHRLGGSVVALEEVSPEETSRYGIISGEMEEEGLYRITDLMEKPAPGKAPSGLAVMGRYVLSPSIFDLLRNSSTGSGGEIQLTDAIRSLSVNEPVWGIMYRGKRFDCGTNESWLRATIAMAMRRDDLRKIVMEEVGSLACPGGINAMTN